MRALILFHLKSGARVAVRTFAPLFCALLAGVTLNMYPAAAVRAMSAQLFRNDTGALLAVCALAFLLPAWGAGRLSAGLNGWMRHLPLTSVAHRRGLALGLVTLQAPLAGVIAVLAGVERPDSGRVTIDGHDLWIAETAARRSLAYVSEQPDLTPYATIGDVLSLVCRLRAEPLSSVRGALQGCGLAALSRRSIRELSMGQRRRAVLAAAWIGSPRHVVLDEPLEAMDRGMRGQILEWVDGLISEQAVVVVATHDIEPFADRAIRAVAVGGGTCGIFEPLPGTGAARLDYLEALSRGGGCGTGGKT